MKRIDIFYAEWLDDNFPTDNMVKFTEWCSSIIEECPEEHRNKLEIEISSEEYYESTQAIINIHYDRELTESEVKEDERHTDRMKEITRSRRKALFEDLKNEFEKGE